MAKLPDGWAYLPTQTDKDTVSVEGREIVFCKNCAYYNQKGGCFLYDSENHLPEDFCSRGVKEA